jgi:tRNA nucleotidyltransferase (CCA-adding enzyme)
LRRSGELDALVAERVWQETQKALACPHPEEFFITLRQCGGLTVLFPEIEALFGVPSEISPQHYMDSGHHALLSLSNASSHYAAPEIRFAALCHSLGKACLPPETWPQLRGYVAASMAPLKRLCDRYKVSQEYRDIAVLTAKHHLSIQHAASMPAAAILDLLAATDSLRRPQRFLLTVQASEACLTDVAHPLHLTDFFMPLIDAVKTAKAPNRDMTDSVPSIKEAMYHARLQAIEQALASRQP